MKAVFLLYELDERKDYEKGVIHGILARTTQNQVFVCIQN